MSEWHDGLTDRQRETVERAAKAAFEQFPPEDPKWDGASDGMRNLYRESALASLRAAYPGDFPPVKAKTRGEEWAEEMLYLADVGGTRMFCIRTCGFSGLGLFETPAKSVTHEERLAEARERLAAAYDDAYAKGRSEAIDEAVKLTTDFATPSRTELAKSILALKGGPR